MAKGKLPNTRNKPCVKCGGHVTCGWRKGTVWRECDVCGYEEPDVV